MTEKEYEGTPELIFYCEYNPSDYSKRLEISFATNYDIQVSFDQTKDSSKTIINIDLQYKKSKIPNNFFGQNIIDVQAIIGKNGVGKTRVLKNIQKLDKEASRVGGIFVLYQYNNQIFVYNGKYDGQPTSLIFKSNDRELPKFRKFDDVSTVFLNGNDFSIAPIFYFGIAKPIFFLNSVREVQQRFNYKYVMQFMGWIGVADKYVVRVKFPPIVDLAIYKENNFEAILKNTFIHSQYNELVIVRLTLFFYFLNFIHQKSYLYKDNLKEIDIFFQKNSAEVNDIDSLTEFLTSCLAKMNDLLAHCFSKSLCLFETIQFEINSKNIGFCQIEVKQFVNNNFIDLIDYLEKPYQDFEEADRVLDYYIPFSEGEKYLLMSLSLIASKLPLTPNKDWKTIIIFMDEYESHLHLEWVRKYLELLLWWLDAEGDELKVKFQIIISTHSPMIISDLPVDNITLLLEDGIKRDKINYGFASNYYDILKDNFFLDDTIGEFAKQKINSCIRSINKISDDLDKLADDELILHDGLSLFIEESLEAIEEQNKIIDLVGDKFIQKQLQQLSDSVKQRLLIESGHDARKQQIEKDIEELEEKLRQKKMELNND